MGGEGVAAFGDGRLDVGEVVAVVAAGVTPGEDGCGGESFDEQVGDPIRRCRRAHSFVTVIALHFPQDGGEFRIVLFHAVVEVERHFRRRQRE